MDHDEELRALWRAQKTETTHMTTEAVIQQDSKLARRIGVRNGLEYVVAAAVAIFFGSIAVGSSHDGALVRVGAALIVGAAVHVAVDLRRRGTALPAPAVDAPTRAHVAHHRAQITRQRDLLATAWRWYVVPFAVSIFIFTLGVGLEVLHHGEALRSVVWLIARVDALVAAVMIFVLYVNRYATRRLTRKLEALDD